MWELARFAVAVAAWPLVVLSEARHERKFRIWQARLEASREWTDGT